MPEAVRDQFYRDYYETYRQKFDSANVPYEDFLRRTEQQVSQDPKFMDRMASELQNDFGQEAETPQLSTQFRQDYYDAYRDKLSNVPFEKFSQLVDDRLLREPKFARKMGDELYTFARHRMSREEFDAYYLKDNEDWTGPLDVMKEGWQTFAQQLGPGNLSAIGDSLHVLGKFFGSDDVAKAGDDLGEYSTTLDVGAEPEVGDWREIESPGDFFKWAAGLGGAGLATIAPVLAGATAGGAAGAALGPAGAVVGAVVGGATPSALLNIGESYQSFRGEGMHEENAIEAAVLTSPAIVALDYIGAKKLLEGAKLGGPVKDALRKVYEGIKSGGIAEGLTETAQDTIRQAVAVGYTGDLDAQRRAGDLLNSFAGGFIVGGGVGGAKGGYQAYRERGQEPPTEEATPTQPEPPVTEETTEQYDPAQDEPVTEPVTQEEEGTTRPAVRPPMPKEDDGYIPSLESYELAEEANQGMRREIPRDQAKQGETVVLDRAGEGPIEGTINMVDQDGTFVVVNDQGAEVARVSPDELEQGTVRFYSSTESETLALEERQPLTPEARANPTKLLSEFQTRLIEQRPTEPKDQQYQEEFDRIITRHQDNEKAGKPTDLTLPQIQKLRNNAGFQNLSRRQRDRIDTFLEHHEERKLLEQQERKALPAPKPKPAEATPAKKPVAKPAPTAPIKAQPASSDKIVTPAGTEHSVDYAVVNMQDLITSHTDEGQENTAYPQELQPRDRSRKSSQMQIQKLAANINPRLLEKSPSADTGAPVIDPSGVVESGNARTMALRLAYSRGQAEQYKEFLENEGYETSGIESPVLVRIRRSNLSQSERQAFAAESNLSSVAKMSRTEQAVADAKQLKIGTLEGYQGGALDTLRNRPFIQSFIQDAVGQTDVGTFVTPDGEVTAEGIQRVEAAMLAAAYDDKAMVERLAEAQDQGRKTVRDILVDVAPQWAMMKKHVEAGTIAKEMDNSQALMDAVRIMDKSVRTNTGLATMLGQESMFEEVEPELSGERGAMTRAFLTAFYKNPGPQGWTKLNNKAVTVNALKGYLNAITNYDPRQTDIFGAATVPPAQNLLEQAIEEAGAGVLARREAQNREMLTDAAVDPAVSQALESIAQRIVPAETEVGLYSESIPGRPPGYTGTFSYANLNDRWYPLIEVAIKANKDPVVTLHHEAVHNLWREGFLTEAEWGTLRREARAGKWLDKHDIRRRYKDLPIEGQYEEAIADEFGHWAARRSGRGLSQSVRRIFEKIRQIFFEIARSLRILGYDTTTAREVFQKMATGQVAKRASTGRRTDPATGATLAQKEAPKEGPHVQFDEKHEQAWKDSWLTPEDTKANEKSLMELAKEWVRQYRYLPNEKQYADLIMKMRPVQEGLHNSAEKVTRFMTDMTKGLSKKDLDLLSRAIYLPDLLWSKANGMEVAFGFETLEELERADAQVKEALEQHPHVAERLEIRKQFMDEVRQELIEADVLSPEALRNRHFIHHQVIQYAKMTGVGGMRSKMMSPTYKHRRGSAKNIVSNYVMVEMEYLFKAFNDIEVSRFLKWLRRSKYNRMPGFVKRAKQENLTALTEKVRTEATTAVQQVLGQSPRLKAITDAKTPNEVAQAFQQIRRDHKEGFDASELNIPILGKFNDFRQLIARNLQTLQKTVGNFSQWQIDQIPPALMPAYKAFKSGGDTSAVITQDAANDPGLFKLINFFMRSPQFEDMADKVAPLLGTIAERRKWVRETAIPKEYVDPNSSADLIEKYGGDEGLQAWQANARSGYERAMHLFSNNAVPSHVVEGMLDQIVAETEAGNMELMGNKGTARRLSQLIRQYKQDDQVVQIPMEEMILKPPVAETLNNFRDKAVEEIFQRSIIKLTGFLKRSMLFLPHRFVPYVVENFWGDSDMMVASLKHGKGIVPYLNQARSEVYASQIGGKQPSESFEYARRYGVTQGGLSMQEIDYLRNANIYDYTTAEFTVPNQKGLMSRFANRYLEFTMGAARLRENVFRYAAFLHFQNELVTKDKPLAEVGHGASNPDVLKGITDKRELAVRMASDFMGDYGGISQIGRRIRQTIFPFWSFPETNATRYYWLFRNAGGPNGKAMAATAGAFLIFKGYVLQQVINNLFFGDQEDDYTWAQRLRPHMNLGKWNGEYRRLDYMGSLMEALKWIGMGPETIAKAIGEYRGREKLEIFWDVLLAPGYNFLGGITPLIKMPLELVAGQTYWPDPQHPKLIKDRIYHAARMFGLEEEYALTAKSIFRQPTPSRGYGKKWQRDVLFKMSSRPVGEQAYFYIRSTTFTYQKDIQGKEPVAARGNPLYWAAKKSMQWGDRQAYKLAMEKIRAGEDGSSLANLRQSIRRDAPLASLAKKDRAAFRATLSRYEEDMLRRAQEWYRFAMIERGLVEN